MLPITLMDWHSERREVVARSGAPCNVLIAADAQGSSWHTLLISP
jgi:hypothetical protein